MTRILRRRSFARLRGPRQFLPRSFRVLARVIFAPGDSRAAALPTIKKNENEVNPHGTFPAHVGIRRDPAKARGLHAHARGAGARPRPVPAPGSDADPPARRPDRPGLPDAGRRDPAAELPGGGGGGAAPARPGRHPLAGAAAKPGQLSLPLPADAALPGAHGLGRAGAVGLRPLPRPAAGPAARGGALPAWQRGGRPRQPRAARPAPPARRRAGADARQARIPAARAPGLVHGGVCHRAQRPPGPAAEARAAARPAGHGRGRLGQRVDAVRGARLRLRAAGGGGPAAHPGGKRGAAHPGDADGRLCRGGSGPAAECGGPDGAGLPLCVRLALAGHGRRARARGARPKT